MIRKTEMTSRMHRHIRVFLLTVLAIVLFTGQATAASILSIHIERDEWSWIGDTAATFKGSLICQGVSEEDPVTLLLTIDASPEQPETGKPVFTSVGGKRLIVKKQSPEYRLSSVSTATTAFTGSWTIPAEGQYDEVTIRIDAVGNDGSILAQDSFVMTNNPSGNVQVRKLPDPEKIIRPVIIAAAVIWVLAMIRILYHRHRR